MGEDHKAAAFPFWDHDGEPPLCAAVRLGNSTAILRALLEAGADVKQVDTHGRAPLQVLRDMTAGCVGQSYARAMGESVDLLLQAGATPSAIFSQRGMVHPNHLATTATDFRLWSRFGSIMQQGGSSGIFIEKYRPIAGLTVASITNSYVGTWTLSETALQEPDMELVGDIC